MKTLATTALFAAALAASPGHAQHARGAHHSPGADATMGVHGMVLFGGRDGLFASHLPLFRPPHDRRIVLQIDLTDAHLDREMREQLAKRAELWTIEPERFALSRLLPRRADPISGFRARLFRGHFERGGVPVYADVEVRVTAVLMNEAITPGAEPPVATTYRTVGAGRTWFLVKDINVRPDFDHIVALAPSIRRPPAAISVSRTGTGPRDAAVLARAAGSRGARTLYFETDDLR